MKKNNTLPVKKASPMNERASEIFDDEFLSKWNVASESEKTTLWCNFWKSPVLNPNECANGAKPLFDKDQQDAVMNMYLYLGPVVLMPIMVANFKPVTVNLSEVESITESAEVN